MSYNTSLQTNNAELQALIDIANALPDATDGVELPELTTPASEAEVFEGYEYIDQEGAAKVGTFTIENELSEQDELLTELEAVLEGKASGEGSSGGSFDTCNLMISGASGIIVYTKYENGVLTVNSSMYGTNISDVLCGTAIYIKGVYLSGTCTAGNIIFANANGCAYQAPTEAGVTATLNLIQD